jgi:hypothetical protein
MDKSYFNKCKEETCGKDIPRKENQSNGDYNRAITCSKTCAELGRTRARLIKQGLLPGPKMVMDVYDYFNLGKVDLLRAKL